MLGFTYFIDTRYGWHRSREESFKKLIEYGQKAVKLDESDPDVHALLANTHVWKKEHDEAIAAAEKAIALGSNSAETHAELSMLYRFAGRFEDSIKMSEKAIRLHPYYHPCGLIHLLDIQISNVYAKYSTLKNSRYLNVPEFLATKRFMPS